MGQAYICDRCKNLFEEKQIKTGTIDLWNEAQGICLCFDCANELDEWLHPEEAKAIKKYIKGK